MGPGGRSGEQCGNQLYRECRKDSRGGFSACAGSESSGAVFAGESVWRTDASTKNGKHCECGVDCGIDGSGRSRGVQRVKAWIGWIDPNAGSGVGRARSACKCGVSGLGEDGDGCGGPGGRKLYGCGYYGPSADGKICFAG